MIPKHLEIVVEEDRVLVRSPAPIECAHCKKVAYFFVNKGGVTRCTDCDRKT